MVKAILILAASLALMNPCHAELIDRGNGMIYDNQANLTWMQDANLAATKTFGPDGPNGVDTHLWDTPGLMDWPNAMGWVSYMNQEKYKGFSDWRLPTTSSNGEAGYHRTDSELGNLFFNVLGNTSDGDVIPFGLINSGPFLNIQSGYWSSSDTSLFNAWWLSVDTGYQGEFYKLYGAYGWVVRSGDVPAVPEPDSGMMLAAGLGVLGLLRLRAAKTMRWLSRTGSGARRLHR